MSQRRVPTGAAYRAWIQGNRNNREGSSGGLAQAPRRRKAKRPKKKRKTKTKRKTATAKRPLSSYMVFVKHNSSSLREKYPDANMVEISKKLGATWRGLSEEQKEFWKAKAEALKNGSTILGPAVPQSGPSKRQRTQVDLTQSAPQPQLESSSRGNSRFFLSQHKLRWKCQHCNFSNIISRTSCIVCRKLKGSQPDGDAPSMRPEDGASVRATRKQGPESDGQEQQTSPTSSPPNSPSKPSQDLPLSPDSGSHFQRYFGGNSGERRSTHNHSSSSRPLDPGQHSAPHSQSSSRKHQNGGTNREDALGLGSSTHSETEEEICVSSGDDMKNFLESISLSEYLPQLTSEGIDIPSLRLIVFDVEQTDFRELVPKMGHRSKMKQGLKKHFETSEEPSSSSSSSSHPSNLPPSPRPSSLPTCQNENAVPDEKASSVSEASVYESVLKELLGQQTISEQKLSMLRSLQRECGVSDEQHKSTLARLNFTEDQFSSKCIREEDNSRDECVICLEMAPTHIILPCGHLCLCKDCAAFTLARCPKCRGRIKKVQKTY